MTEQLRRALGARRDEIENSLDGAEARLRELEEERAELLALVREAEIALGRRPATSANGRVTLHEAIALVLREHGNDWRTARELWAEIKDRDLYRGRDGSPAALNQIHARTTNYADLFEKDGSRIRLRDDEPNS